MAWIDREVDGDRWAGSFDPDAEGIWTYEVGAFTDHFATWHDEVSRKRAAGGEDLSSEVDEGARAAARRPSRAPRSSTGSGSPPRSPSSPTRPPTSRRSSTRSSAPRLLEAVERDPERRDFATAPAAPPRGRARARPLRRLV